MRKSMDEMSVWSGINNAFFAEMIWIHTIATWFSNSVMYTVECRPSGIDSLFCCVRTSVVLNVLHTTHTCWIVTFGRTLCMEIVTKIIGIELNSLFFLEFILLFHFVVSSQMLHSMANSEEKQIVWFAISARTIQRWQHNVSRLCEWQFVQCIAI